MNRPPIPASIPHRALSMSSIVRERGVRALKQSAVLAAIRNRASEIGLDPAGVARKLGLSVRYLHRLLQSTGRTFAEHLLDRRLAIATALLRDQQGIRLKIGEIAARAGFGDFSHFSRSFRHAFGDTPFGLRTRTARKCRDAGERGPQDDTNVVRPVR
jgi:AraC-like DNA-binding protein